MPPGSPRLSAFRASFLLGRAACLGAAILASALPLDAAALVAHCEDGSVVLARRWEDVHCAGAVEVAAGEVPRLGYPRARIAPDWREMRRRREQARELDLDLQVERARAAQLPPQPPGRVPQPGRFELPEAEHRALSRFLAQSLTGVEAVIAGNRVEGSGARMQLGHSAAFQARLLANLEAGRRQAAGPVLVFSLAPGTASLTDVPTFAQGGASFRPRSSDPGQLGWVVPRTAVPGGRHPQLGYVVLPPAFELGRPLVLFWGDAVAAARLSP